MIFDHIPCLAFSPPTMVSKISQNQQRAQPTERSVSTECVSYTELGEPCWAMLLKPDWNSWRYAMDRYARERFQDAKTRKSSGIRTRYVQSSNWKRKDLSFIALADHQLHFLEFSFSVFFPVSFCSSFILILQIKIMESDDLFKTSDIAFVKTAISNMIVSCE
jgi:hypothetical protein